MDSPILQRSTALNNIPSRKFQEKLLSAIHNCKICSERDMKYKSVFDGLCQKCSLVNVAFNRYYEANIPIEYWDLKMDKDFHGYPGLLAKYKEIVADLNKTYVSGTAVCFAGLHGRGKSLTASCILKKACHKNFQCLYTTLSDVVSVLTGAVGEDRFMARKELLLVDFLVLDEFDNRFFSSDNAADLFARTLEGVFRTRSQNKLPTFMCTNSPNIIEAFTGPLKQSIDSLMSGYMTVFPVLGTDFRKQGAV